LISLDVTGYNVNIATEEYDVWAITILFAFLEGYHYTYFTFFYNPI